MSATTTRWQRALHRIKGDSLYVAVDPWRDVLVAGSVLGTPQLDAVFKTNWSTYSAGAAPNLNVCQYMKDPFGFVHLRGAAKKGIAGVGGDDEIYTLPVGYRPYASGRTGGAYFTTISVAATTHVANGRCEVRVAHNGVVAGINGTAGATFTSFDGITFRAEDF